MQVCVCMSVWCVYVWGFYCENQNCSLIPLTDEGRPWSPHTPWYFLQLLEIRKYELLITSQRPIAEARENSVLHIRGITSYFGLCFLFLCDVSIKMQERGPLHEG